MTAEQCVDFVRRSYITITSGCEKVNVVDISGGYRPSDKGEGGGAVSKKIFFSPSGLILAEKEAGSGPPGPLPWIRH